MIIVLKCKVYHLLQIKRVWREEYQLQDGVGWGWNKHA